MCKKSCLPCGSVSRAPRPITKEGVWEIEPDYFRSGVGKQRPTGQIWSGTCFSKIKFYRNTATRIRMHVACDSFCATVSELSSDNGDQRASLALYGSIFLDTCHRSYVLRVLGSLKVLGKFLLNEWMHAWMDMESEFNLTINFLWCVSSPIFPLHKIRTVVLVKWVVLISIISHNMSKTCSV